MCSGITRGRALNTSGELDAQRFQTLIYLHRPKSCLRSPENTEHTWSFGATTLRAAQYSQLGSSRVHTQKQPQVNASVTVHIYKHYLD